jgi:hypothetical protein
MYRRIFLIENILRIFIDLAIPVKYLNIKKPCMSYVRLHLHRHETHDVFVCHTKSKEIILFI